MDPIEPFTPTFRRRTPVKTEAEERKVIDDFINSVYDKTNQAFRKPIPKESQQEKENYSCLLNNAKHVYNQYKHEQKQAKLRDAKNEL
jgi:hypothetical protein